MQVKFDVFWNKDLGTFYKDNSVDTLGKEANVNIDLDKVLRIYVNFQVGEKSYTDNVEILDVENKLIRIPFKTDVIKQGLNKFELVAVMKDNSVLPSQTYTYKVDKSLENPNSVEADTNYPILIQLLRDVGNKMNDIDEATEKLDEFKEIVDSLGEFKEIANVLDKIGDIEGELIEVGDKFEDIESNYAKKTDIPLIPTKISQLINDKNYLTSIPNEYITETELESKGYLTKHQDISGKADKTELHNHTNKTVLDGITSVKVQSWDSKSTFSGNYNDLTNKPTIPSLNGYATKDYVNQEINKIDVTNQLTDYAKKSELPTKVSQLTNDKGYMTSIPSEYVTETELNAKGYLTEHQDISGKADKTELNSLSLGVHTDGMIYLFKNGQPIGDGIEITAQEVVAGDVIGNVDEDNNIILSGNLENGTYVFKYENADGTFTKIGEFEINEGTISLYTNLLKTLEVHLNKRYSGSSNAITSDGTGSFCIIIPLTGDGLTHTLRFANLKTPLANSTVSTMYLLDSSLKNIGIVNGNKAFKNMTNGVTISDNGKAAQVDFTAITGMSFIGLTVEVNETKTPITNSDIVNYIITLDEEIE